MNKISVEILGSGGAFDFNKTSSSFLISLEHYNILVDCGHNVLARLENIGKNRNKNYIETLEKVVITHLHMNHIADLETLIYYRYFKYNKRTEIIIAKDLIKDFINIFPKEKYSEIYINEYIKIDPMYKLTAVDSIDKGSRIPYYLSNNEYDIIEMVPILMNHSKIVPSYGWIFYINNKCKFIISGDSKASYNLVKLIETLDNESKIGNRLIIYHDFNNYLKPFESLHMCKEDFEEIYKDIIKDSRIEFIKYHNGDNVGKVKKF